ncbi:MAG: DUF669 domain-containing protein [Clostridiales Family XIII bacterium]|jgi:hypothetical protein|nr:DUF669 domain-containing protein [Clostridiales Family XIII bacterium]
MTEKLTFDWDDTLDADAGDGGGFLVLPPGEYAFTVANYERSRYNGSAKTPACAMAKVQLRIEAEEGTAHVFDRLYFSTKARWRVVDFLRAVGVMPEGEGLKGSIDAAFADAVGASGRAKIGIRTYDGNEYNEVKSYIKKKPGEAPAAQPAGTKYSW